MISRSTPSQKAGTILRSYFATPIVSPSISGFALRLFRSLCPQSAGTAPFSGIHHSSAPQLFCARASRKGSTRSPIQFAIGFYAQQGPARMTMDHRISSFRFDSTFGGVSRLGAIIHRGNGAAKLSQSPSFRRASEKIVTLNTLQDLKLNRGLFVR
jgi:hypothetical protein